MTKQADFKRRVRARMARTGESYATARGHLLAESGAAPHADAESGAAPHADAESGAAPHADAESGSVAWMVDALHVSNGDATDLPGTGLARRVLYWRDALHEGPVPAVGAEELRRIRAEFLVGAGAAGGAGQRDADDRGEAEAIFVERDRTLADNRDGEYVLWFEADLYDQLQIIQVLSRLAELEVPAHRVTLICIGEHAGIARFGGLGELTADQLRELPSTNACARLTGDAYDLATRAWAALRAPTPAGLAAIAASRSGELRFLGEAFDRLSREYPSTRDGLSLTERRVLAAVADGAADAGSAFERAWRRETRPYLGDTFCFAIMDRLARSPHPLLRVVPADRDVDRFARLGLTDTGARVLAGEADHAALNGVDRWIGGVHLHGPDVRWRWDDAREAIVDLSR